MRAAAVDARAAARIPPRDPAHAAHYLAFPTADALTAFLDARSAAGTLVSAHRGGPGPGYPDNSLQTFERATSFGPMLVELDVRRTADGQLVILHDDEVSRTTDGQGRVGTLTLDSLLRLRLRDAAGTPTAHPVPSLAEALEWAAGRAVLRLDVKGAVTPEAVVGAVRAADASNRVMVIARSPDEVRRYRALAPDLALSFWYDPDGDGRLSLAEARSLLATALATPRTVVGVGSVRAGWEAAVLDTLRAHGIRGMVSTFGALDSVAATDGAWEAYCPLVAAGVGVLVTDAAREAARAVRACPARHRAREGG